MSLTVTGITTDQNCVVNLEPPFSLHCDNMLSSHCGNIPLQNATTAVAQLPSQQVARATDINRKSTVTYIYPTSDAPFSSVIAMHSGWRRIVATNRRHRQRLPPEAAWQLQQLAINLNQPPASSVSWPPFFFTKSRMS